MPEAAARSVAGSASSTVTPLPALRLHCTGWEMGNLSNAKGVGGGVLEYSIDFGPGYRIYFGRDGDALIMLLGGGTKARQQRDIEAAMALWREYRRSKRQEG